MDNQEWAVAIEPMYKCYDCCRPMSKAECMETGGECVECKRRRLARYKSEKAAKISKGKRAKAIKRDGHCCQYCGSREDLVADHVIPHSVGGSHDLTNLKACCRTCNCSKSNRDLEAFRWQCRVKKSKYHPIINSAQAQKLIALGVVLDIPEHLFFFEELDND